MGGNSSQSSDQNVIIPHTGDAKYWYVDPRAQPFDPMEYFDNQGHTDQDIEKILREMGLLEDSTPNL